MLQIIIVCIAVAIACFIAYKIGEKEGFDEGILMGEMRVLQKFGNYQNKVVEIVPPEKYDDLKVLTEYFYEEINTDN